MTKNRTLASLIILFLMAGGVDAITIDEALPGIPEVVADELLESKEVFRLDRQSEGFKLLPSISMTRELIRRTNKLQPDVLTEGLFIIPYSESIDGINVEFYNMTRKISSLSGVTYLSRRKRAVIPLFSNVYAISALKGKKPIDDPLVDSIPTSDSILLYMKEANFSRAYYQIDYIWDGQSLGFFMRNLSNLRFVVKVVDKEQMQIAMLILPVDEGFLIHSSSVTTLSNSKLVFNLMDPHSSFYRRIYALVIWIYNTMHNTDRIPDFGEPLEM